MKNREETKNKTKQDIAKGKAKQAVLSSRTTG